MVIGFLQSKDPRCPVSDTSVKKFEKLGVQMLLENGLGEDLGLQLDVADHVSYQDRINTIKKSDILYSTEPLSPEELSAMSEDAILLSFYAPFNPTNQMDSLSGVQNEVYSMDMIPRTTLAQSMDVLSSMASIAGYKAVLLAAEQLPRYFPMMMTAAGTVKPATVLIFGAGVAGLQAIATAKRLGAKVEVFDVRRAVKTEVESLGGKFVEVEGSTDDKDAGGYAVEQTEEYKQKQKAKIHERVSNADVVITTAQLRGRTAPILVTTAMVNDMKHGSVIIDLAASTGGNCELTQNDTTITHVNGVKIIGDSFLANRALIDASSLLSNNIYNYANTFIKDGALHIDKENEITVKSRVHPPQNN